MLGLVRVKHRTLSIERRVTSVHASDAACLLLVSLTESTGRSGHVRWFTSGAPERLHCSLGKGPDAHECVWWCGSGDPVRLQFSLRT